jgi:hypothetical protein
VTVLAIQCPSPNLRPRSSVLDHRRCRNCRGLLSSVIVIGRCHVESREQ